MIVSLKANADPTVVLGALAARGLWVSQVERASGGATHYVIAAHSAAASAAEVAAIDGIADVTTTKSPFPRVERQGPFVDVGGVRIAAPESSSRPSRPVLMCGPCSVESQEQVSTIAAHLARLGVPFLRGGAFKPRTSPYAFQGHGADALAWLRRAADAHRMKVVTEALAEADVALVAEHADMVQVGSRNMQNYSLLKAIGRTGKPVLLKRGMAATVDEWLQAGEYLLAGGASGVVFCERGIRGFDTSTRNLLDLGAVALLAHVHHLPVIVDPSHGAGRRDLVPPLAAAALAAGAAGVMIETHDDPARALSDGPQAIPLADLGGVLRELVRPEPAPVSGGAS
jgi:3-deoxy-7-phosphoheptulonate synthase